MQFWRIAFATALFWAWSPGQASEGTGGLLVSADVRPKEIGFTVHEGPAVDPDGTVFFSDLAGNRMLRMSADGKVSVFREDSGRANGNAFDTRGRLLTAEGAEIGAGGRRRIVRTDLASGEVTVVADRYQGRRFNSPNDLALDPQGRLWFTDAYYGRNRSMLELDEEAVYRIDPVDGELAGGRVTRVVGSPQVQRPNGVAISTDGRLVYVVDSNTAPGGNRKIWSFEIQMDGSLAQQKLIYDFGKGRGGDGIQIDVDGNLWVAAGVSRGRFAGETDEVRPGIHVISPQGVLLGIIATPEDTPNNLTFIGADRRTLLITTVKTVYQVPVLKQGRTLPLRLQP